MNKDFKYILKRVLIGVSIGLILFYVKSCNVKALTNEDIGLNVEFPLSNVAYVSMNSNLNINNKGFRYFHGSTLLPNLYFGAPTDQNLTCGTFGCGVNIGGLSLLKDNYYSITIYLLGDNSPNWHYSYSSYNSQYNVAVNSSFQTYNTSDFVPRSLGTTQLNKVCDNAFNNEYTGNCLFRWTIMFKAPKNGTNLTTWWSSNPTGGDPNDNGFFVGYTLAYVGDSSLTSEQLNASLNTMTTNITNSINNAISNSSNNIINNQNQNTSAILGSITGLWQNIIHNDEVCFDYNIRITSSNYDSYSRGFLNSDGTIGNSNNYVISNYIHLNPNKNYNLSLNYYNNSSGYCIYNSNKELIACYSYNSNRTFNIHVNNDSYIRFSAKINDSSLLTYFTGNYCGTGNQILYDSQNQNSQNINDSINQVNDTITDETPPNLSGLSNSAGWLPAGPVDSILNLPLSLLNNLSSNLSNQCQPVVLPVPFVNTDITLPCIMTIYEQIGITTWVNLVGTIASAFILLSYLIRLYKWVDDTLTFRENNYLDNWGGI